MTKKTLESLLNTVSDGTLLNMLEELSSGIVPATGAAHSFCRKVNRRIDSGKLCINPTTYRKVYLPTLSKAVYKEAAERYMHALCTGEVYPRGNIICDQYNDSCTGCLFKPICEEADYDSIKNNTAL